MQTDKEKRVKYQAIAILGRMGVTHKTVLPSIWRMFLSCCAQLVAQGYQERYIQFKLEQIATNRILIEKEKRAI